MAKDATTIMFQVKGEYRGVPVGCMAPEGSKTRQGSQQTRAALEMTLKQVLVVVTKRAVDTVNYLGQGLSNVYSNEEVIFLKHVRKLLDLKELVKLVQSYGAASVAATQYRSWLDACKFLNQDLHAKVPQDELRQQYRDFVIKVGELAPGLGNLSNTEIFGRFLDPALGHYRGIQSVLELMASAGMTMGLESIVESWVSVCEHHNNPRRPITQDRLEQEAMIAINGPSEVHCDAVVQEALGKYWRKKKRATTGHWIR